jgi:hypothetical protein
MFKRMSNTVNVINKSVNCNFNNICKNKKQ